MLIVDLRSDSVTFGKHVTVFKLVKTKKCFMFIEDSLMGLLL